MKLIAKILLGLTGLGLAAGAVAFAVNLNKKTEPVINQSVLYIGIPKQQDGMSTSLHLTVKSSSGTATKEYSSDELTTLDGQDENIVFLNYAENPVIPLNGKEIGYWLSDSQNSIRVQTECLELIYSDYISIDKTGIWFINVASRDGYTPDFSHSYIYSSGGLGI